jgi:hypothetical protein
MCSFLEAFVQRTWQAEVHKHAFCTISRPTVPPVSGGGKTNVQRMFFRALVWQPKSKEEDSIKVVHQMRGFALEEDSMANVLQRALDVLYLLLMTPGGG